MKKTIYFCLTVCFLFSCGRNNYVAEFSYSVDGEYFTVYGGGISYAEWFESDTIKFISYRSVLYSPFDNGREPIIRDTSQSYHFYLMDFTGGKKTRFDMQNPDEVYPYFYLTYKGKNYRAISGYVDIKKTPIKKSEKIRLQGFFEAVMVYPIFYPTDTIIVKNGAFYYSESSYGKGYYD